MREAPTTNNQGSTGPTVSPLAGHRRPDLNALAAQLRSEEIPAWWRIENLMVLDRTGSPQG